MPDHEALNKSTFNKLYYQLLHDNIRLKDVK